MKKLIATLAVAVLGALLAPIAPASADEPARVLIVGDSVTHGYRGDYTWRYFFNKARPDIDLVGRRTGTFNVDEAGAWDFDYNGPDAYADPYFDQDHGATYGGRIGKDDNVWFYDPIGRNVSTYQPDVIFALWGFNDLHHKDDGPAEVVASYDEWIAEARAVNPEVDIILGGLSQNWDPEVPALNAALADLAALRDTGDSRVLYAPAPGVFTRADTKDGVHPNTEGQIKIASQFTAAVEALLPGPVEPVPSAPVPTPVAPTPVPAPANLEQIIAKAPAPARPMGVKARAKIRRTVVTWRRVEGADRYAVRCGVARRETVARKVVLRSSAMRCKVRSINESGASRWAVVRVR